MIDTGREIGPRIARELLRVKIGGQRRVAQRLGIAIPEYPDPITAEAEAARIYWTAWRDIELRFARSANPPDHWKRFGTRVSPLTGSPRKAATPGNAMLNYLYGVAAAEITAALSAAGLDPYLGIFHYDRDNRASLSWDVIEPIRPIIDEWFLSMVNGAVWVKADFLEDRDGTIRLCDPLPARLAMTAALWRQPAEQTAQWLCECLSSGRVRPLTLSTPSLTILPSCCAECGLVLPRPHARFCSTACARAHDAAHGGVASPDEYATTIAPLLADFTASTIRDRLGISHSYAAAIRAGRVPHRRHFAALAALVRGGAGSNT